MQSKTYLFCGPHLFPVNGTFKDPVEEPTPMTLKCVNVKPTGDNNFMNASTWEFQIEGRGDQWYRTHYYWALVEDTPENHALFNEREALYATMARLRAEVDIISARLTTIRPKRIT